MIAERDHVGARGEQLVRELRRDPGAVRDVLAVDDAEVGGELVAQAGQPLLHGAAPRGTEDVCEEEESQLRTSVAAGRSSTVTWLPASFVYRASACFSMRARLTTLPSLVAPPITFAPT